MYKSVVLIVLMVFVGYFFALFGPWWAPLLSCFLIGVLKLRSGAGSFLFGAIAMLVLWLGMAIYLESKDSTSLTDRVGGIFTDSIPALQSIGGFGLIYLLLSIMAVLLGGLATLSGARVARLLGRDKQID